MCVFFPGVWLGPHQCVHPVQYLADRGYGSGQVFGDMSSTTFYTGKLYKDMIVLIFRRRVRDTERDDDDDDEEEEEEDEEEDNDWQWL